MIQKIIRLSDFPLLNKLLVKGKTILAHDKKNYYVELDQIKGDQIIHSEEIEANPEEGERKNVIKLDFDTNKTEYFTVYNGEDGDQGNKGEVGEKGYKGNSFNKREMLNRADDALVIANDDETNDPEAVWSAFRGKVMEEFLRSIAEKIVTDEEYQLLFNEQIFIDLEFVTKTDAQPTALVHNDNKTYKTYIKYWTYEDDGGQSYFIKTDNNTYQEVIGFDLWNDYYLNPDNEETYYTRKLVITEVDPITGEVISSEYQYTPITKPIWLDLEFTSTREDENSILLSKMEGDDDPADISKDPVEEEIIILHRPITAISIDGNDHITIPINSILTKGINIQPTNYLNSPICIEYDETKIEVFEDGRIMALENNCETIVKIYSQENPEIYANIYVNVITYVDSIQFNTSTIKSFAGYRTTIDYTVLPETASNKTIKWSSTNPEIATVDETGTIELVDVGTATIYAEATDGSGKVSRIDVTVDTAVADIIFNTATEEVDEETGDTNYVINALVGIPTEIPVTVLPNNASNKRLIWESNNININAGAAADGTNGQIYVSTKGNAKLTIYPEDGSDVIRYLNVIGKLPVRNITLNVTNANIDLGDTLQLIAEITENADNRNIIWTSSNDNIATVSNDGLVTAIAGGNVTITALAADGSGVFATCDIISVVLITDIQFTEKNIELHVGSTYAFIKDENYTIEPIGANITQLNWYTSNNEIASISNNGEITAHKAGKVKVYASAMDNSGVIASVNVVVTVPSAQLLLSDYELTLNVDQSHTLIATVIPNDTSMQNVEFISLDPDIAQVDSNGNILAVSSGETSIFVRTLDTNISDKCDITVL